MFVHATENCKEKCKRNMCIKRHRKICKYGESCKHKTKCEFRHNKEGHEVFVNEISGLKKAFNDILENKVKSEKMITTLEKSIKDIKAENVQLSETINNISVELKKLKEICEELKRAQPDYTAPPISQPLTRTSQAIPKQRKEIKN